MPKMSRRRLLKLQAQSCLRHTFTRAGLLMRKSSFWGFWEVNTHVPPSITQVIPNCALVESAIGKKLDSVFKEYTGNFLWFRHWAWIQELAV